MTGEITITGNVPSMGGVREKVIGAHRAGIKKLFYQKIMKNIDEIPEELKSLMTIHFAKTYTDVKKLVFIK